MPASTPLPLRSRPVETTRFDLDDLEDSVRPPFLVNPRAYLYEKQRRHTESLHRNVRPDRMMKVNPTKWKVCGVGPNSWRENTLDTRTIYSMKDVFFSDGRDDSNFDSYIEHTRPNPSNHNPRRFTLQILQRYHKGHSDDSNSSYGAPVVAGLLPQKSTLTQLVDNCLRPPSAVQIVHKRSRFPKCPANNQPNLCDVLGPVSCKDCIEQANRHVAKEIESAAFPSYFDCSATSLVAPKLSQVLAKKKTRRREKPIPEPATPLRNTHIRTANKTPVKIVIQRKTSRQKSGCGNIGTCRKDCTAVMNLPAITSGVPKLSGDKTAKVRVRLYARQWEARAKDFFPDDRNIKEKVLDNNISEQQRRLNKILNNIKYKSAATGM